MENLKLVDNLKQEVSTKKIIEKKTSDALFDVSKSVPNELVIWTFSAVFAISVVLAVWIKIHAKKKWYNKAS